MFFLEKMLFKLFQSYVFPDIFTVFVWGALKTFNALKFQLILQNLLNLLTTRPKLYL